MVQAAYSRALPELAKRGMKASFRIQPTCMNMGEAAGIAAAWGISHGIEANALRWEDIPAEERSYVSEG